jgi:hypothetical protein
MIFLYTSLVVVFAVAGFLIRRRVAGLEKKYTRLAGSADELLRTPLYRKGNSSLPDPYLSAKRQYQLGLLAQRRDRIEGKYAAWQTFSEKFDRFVKRFRGWQGRKLPYTCGVLDVAATLYIIDYLGFGQVVNARALVDLVSSWFTG